MGELSVFNRVVIAILVLIVMGAAVRNVRRRELSLGTGVLWLGGGCLALFVLMVPQILTLVTELVGAKYPASALTLYAFLFFGTMLVILGSKLEKMLIQLTQIQRNLSLLDRRLRHLELKESKEVAER